MVGARNLAQVNMGPIEIIAQYTLKRCVNGRCRSTCQMSLKAASMVMMSMSEVTIRNRLPMAFKPEALAANWFRYSMTFSDTDGGIRLLVRKFSSATRNSANSGKAVNRARTTASNGTMASTVVKVRMEAT